MVPNSVTFRQIFPLLFTFSCFRCFTSIMNFFCYFFSNRVSVLVFSLKAPIRTNRGSFQILRLSAFISAQEVLDYVKTSLRKWCLKLATLTQNLTLLFHRYFLLIKNVLQCSCQAKSQSPDVFLMSS